MNTIDRVKYIKGLDDDIAFLERELKTFVKFMKSKYFDNIVNIDRIAFISDSGKVVSYLSKIAMLKQLKSDLKSGIEILKYVK